MLRWSSAAVATRREGHRSPTFRLMSGHGTEQPVCLAVDPVGEVQDIGAAVEFPPQRTSGHSAPGQSTAAASSRPTTIAARMHSFRVMRLLM